MPRLDWFAFYPADYDADTWHLTPMQDYAYFRILKAIFLTGQHLMPPSILDNEKYLRKLCRPASDEEWSETREVLIDGPQALLQSEGGKITQKRMTAEIAKALGRSQQAQGAARARWGDAGQGPKGENVATVKSGGRNGNGNGHDHLSKRHFVTLAGKIADWRGRTDGLYAGDGEAFDAAFQREFSITWTFWEAEMKFHEGGAS